MRARKAALAAAILAGVFSGGSAARAAGMPAGGSVEVFVTPGNGLTGPIVFTGAIGDYGKFVSIDKDGKPDVNGNYVKITLRKGGFEIDSTALNKKASSARPAGDKATCSAALSVSDPVTLFDGSGLYKGISGTLMITETFAFVGPRYATGAHKGQCDQSTSAQPIAQYGSIQGKGAVRFG